MRRIALLFAMAACGDGAAPADPYVEVALIASPSRDLDLLFVIDDSASVLHLQTSLKAAFPALIDELTAVTGQLPNLHIGVTTSDLGTRGYDDAAPGPDIGNGAGSCHGDGKAGRLQGAFISDVANDDGTRTISYTGSLADAFAAIASVGSAGCGFEQPLEAMRLALVDASGPNAGFLRPTARLAVIALQDEDDCSFSHSTLLGSDVDTLGPLQSFRCTRFGVTCDDGGATSDDMATPGDKAKCHSNETSPFLAPIARYRDVLATIKPDPRDVVFAAIAGDPAPITVENRTPPGGGVMTPAVAHSCSWQIDNGTAVADPAVRMFELARTVRRGVAESVCAADLQPVARAIGREIRKLLGDTCLQAPLVGDCKVVAETLTDEHEVTYDVVPDASCGGGARLQVTTPPSADTMLSVRCR